MWVSSIYFVSAGVGCSDLNVSPNNAALEQDTSSSVAQNASRRCAQSARRNFRVEVILQDSISGLRSC